MVKKVPFCCKLPLRLYPHKNTYQLIPTQAVVRGG